MFKLSTECFRSILCTKTHVGYDLSCLWTKALMTPQRGAGLVLDDDIRLINGEVIGSKKVWLDVETGVDGKIEGV